MLVLVVQDETHSLWHDRETLHVFVRYDSDEVFQHDEEYEMKQDLRNLGTRDLTREEGQRVVDFVDKYYLSWERLTSTSYLTIVSGNFYFVKIV